MHTQFRKVITSVVVAGALVFSGLSFASATEPYILDSTKDGTSSIVLHKRKTEARTQPAIPNAGGKEVTSPAGEGFDGVVFKIRKVKTADLKTYEGYKEAVKLTAQEVLKRAKADENATLESAVQQTTQNGGEARFENLKFGVYLVEEVSAPSNDVSKVAPFLVFVPTSAQGTAGKSEWNYEVHAYPKNTTFTATKTVDTPDHENGHSLTYTILGDIPAHTDKDIVSHYALVDTLDRQVTLKENDVKVEIVEIAGSNPEALTKDTHYKLITTQSNDSLPKTTVRLALTKEGLKKIQGKTTTHQVKFTVPVTVKDNVIGDVTNGGTETPTNIQFNVIPKEPSDNDPNEPKYPDDPTENPGDPGTFPTVPVNPKDPNGEDPDNPSTPVVTKFAGLKFKKVASEDDPATTDVNEATDGLPGAKFEVWTCSYTEGYNGQVGQPSDKLTPVKKVQAQEVTTLGVAKTYINSAAGVVEKQDTDNPQGEEINVGKSEALVMGINKSTTLPANHTFCLVETAAPSGYDLLPTPVYVGTLNDGVNDITSTPVPNIKSSLFNLPNTGGMGVIIFALIGAGLVFLGFVVARRRKEEEAEA